LNQAESHGFDFVVVGGGLAGLCAAIAAARSGLETALIQDRPVLGGNSSSEVRVSPGSPGLHVPWAMEGGIIQELILEDRWRNHGRFWSGYMNSIWDLILYEWATREERLSLVLNTSIRHVSLHEDCRIAAVSGFQLGSERALRFEAPLFCDATGDGTVAFLAGARYRYGREAAFEFGEPGAPEVSDSEVLPSSVLMRARQLDRPVPFRPPPWAAEYPDEEILFSRSHYDPENDMYLWLEIGSPFDTLADNEAIRDDLLKHVLGVWDHIKNHCTHKEQAVNWALEWVGMVVGKRESRRIEGDYWLQEQDVTGAARFHDTVAYGAWFVDHHNPRGILAQPGEHWIAEDDLRQVMVKPYGIPYRCLYAKDVPNLFLAGRCISVTHMALGSVRLMPTLAVCGQAVGTAAKLCLTHGLLPREVGKNSIGALQQRLIRDGCFLPGVAVMDSADLACKATVTATSSALLRLEPDDGEQELQVGLAQLFPVSGNRIDTVWLKMRSERQEPVPLRLGLRSASNCWGLDSMQDLAIATALIPPHLGDMWLPFRLEAGVEPGRLYWVYVEAQPGVFWKDAAEIPIGCVAAWEVEFQREYFFYGKRRFARSLRLTPESCPFGPQNVTGAPGRPEAWTNAWVSDPADGLPQALTLEWPAPVCFNQAELLFDSNLNREYRYIEPQTAPPELVRDYAIQAWIDGAWHSLVQETGNRMRRRVHAFGGVAATRLRVVVQATNRDPSARICAVRVYAEE